MATLLLSAAGASVGSAIGGSFLGIGAATIGQAAGGVAGALIDQAILGGGSKAVESGRARALRIQASTEGAPVPLVYGRMRVGGQLIWSTRYLEHVRTTTRGGKTTGASATTVREFSYTISIAVALGEGPIDRVGRIWADGKLLDTEGMTLRVYRGTDDQLPDPKIEAVEGAGQVPAYRGTAYVVFEDLAVGRFGNRIPQLSFEVFRSVHRDTADPETGEPVPQLVRGVALSPGTGEFALEPEPVRYLFPGGGSQFANVNNAEGRANFQVALDQLKAELPDCGRISLVLGWFGDDLRADRCRVEPKVELQDRTSAPHSWQVTGLTTATAAVVSGGGEGQPNFGGTPSDGSVIRAIAEMQGRGLSVLLYPFLLMDIPAGNGLTDPYTGGPDQPAFPWRGRITLAAAPGQPGSSDQTAAAAAEVAALFGTASAADFAVKSGSVAYSGPDEWTYRRMVLHMAALAAAAGGVEAICIGSELRGLTTIRSDKTTYPAVAELRALADEVRQLMPDAKIGYAADWSEYFGHQPDDGTGDRIFHLDPLWADSQIDFVGIDDYTPLADWRHTPDHLDRAAGAASVYSLPYLQSNIEGGEQYDWFYAGEADRTAQIRTPIADGAHAEDWVFRPKDIRNWWANAHHDRIDGVRQATSTAWVPESKPIWLTETGCPAVDLGANQPNLFFDPKSSESGLPHGSVGARDDEMQRRFLQAKLGYWQDPDNNPLSAAYGGLMIPDDRIYVWTWDGRPWPDFPVRESVWADGPRHALGHWITGRVTAGGLADVVWDITRRAGMFEVEVTRIFGAVHGYLIESTGTGREALQPLMLAYAFDAVEAAGALAFTLRSLAPEQALDSTRLVVDDEPGSVVATRASAGERQDAVRLSYIQAESDYRVAAVEARRPEGDLSRIGETSFALALPGSQAQAIADRWLAESESARERVQLALPPSDAALVPGDIVSLPAPVGAARYRIERLTGTGAREVEAVRLEPRHYGPSATPERRLEPEAIEPPGPLEILFLDLPLANGGAEDHQPRIAATADPWPGEVAVYASPTGADFRLETVLRRPALIGSLAEDLPAGLSDLWQRVSVEIAIPTGALSSGERIAVLNGANALALEAAPAVWELLQFREAELTAPGRYRLTTLLRGRRGTEALAAAPILAGARLVVLDEAVAPLPLEVESLALERQYRVGPARRDLSNPAFIAAERSFEGVGLIPFAPVHLRAHRNPATGDIQVDWIRRTRINGDSWSRVEVPLGEAREAYRLRILAGTTLLREAETATSQFTYTAADQAADGAGGALEIRVAQLSEAVGYGPEQGTIFDD